jgi:ATP-binding protein involved in chromosome partitioning
MARGMTEIETLQNALNGLTDPTSGRGLFDCGRVSGLRFSDGKASMILDVTGLSPADRDALDLKVHQLLETIPEVKDIRVAMTSEKTGRRIIAVASGKGGVGKSTVSVNIALALHQAGVKVGLVDADIYGPSQPLLTSTQGQRPEAEDKRLLPVMTQWGMPILSIGHLVKPDQAIAWRGPMAGNALSQMIDADWADTQVLIVDMPPGTGDVQLSMVQKHKPAGAIIVSTPQDVALIDATRAMDLFKTAGVPIIGMVENMAGYACPHCGEVSDPFGQGGTERAAQEKSLPFLGRIPLSLNVRIASDAGTPPVTMVDGDGESFVAIAEILKRWLANT